MTARIYSIETQIVLFDAKITEKQRSCFEMFLISQGFVYVTNDNKWVNKERGHEAIIRE